MRSHYRRYERSKFSMNSSNNDTSTISSNTGQQVIHQDNQVSFDKESLSNKRSIFRSGSKSSIINIKGKSSKTAQPFSNRYIRTDSFGIPINHFNKRLYKVAFVDQLSSNCRPFAEVIQENVTSNIKQEDNEIEKEKKKDNYKDETLCKCIVF